MGLFGPPNIEKMKNKKGIKGLIKALEYKKDAKIQEDAKNALIELGNDSVLPLINSLENKDEYYVNNIGNILVTIGDPAIEPLINALSRRGINYRKVWKSFGESAVEPLINAVRNGKEIYPSHRFEDDGFLFGEIGKPAIEPLINALNDNNQDVRIFAVRGLGEIYDEKQRAVGPIITSFNDNVDPEFRSLALTSLRNIGRISLKNIEGQKAFETIINSLEDDDNTIRIVAVTILGQMGDKRAINPLKELLDDETVGFFAKNSLSELNKI